MKKIKVYWNNICLLRRAEENFINEYAKHGLDIEIEYFGLGMPQKLREKIAVDLGQYNEPQADVIVSTDLDIFQDKRLLLGKFDLFADIAGEFIIRNEVKETGTEYPFCQIVTAQVLPLFICVNEEITGGMAIPESLKDLCEEDYNGKIVLGGNDTAAGRSLIMCIWFLYGEEYAMKFLRNAVFVPIPAMAYNAAAIKKEFPICILPSVLSGRGLKTIFPKDGAPAIPSYICVRKDAPGDAVDFLQKTLFGIDMQSFYAERGFILPSHQNVKINPVLMEDNVLCRFVYPDYYFIQNFDMTKFCGIMDGIAVMK